MRSIVQEQRKITESCPDFLLRCCPWLLDDPHERLSGLSPEFAVDGGEGLVGNGRAAPPFRHTPGKGLYVADGLPRMEDDFPSQGIAVCGIHAMQKVLGFNAPLAGSPFPDDVLSHG